MAHILVAETDTQIRKFIAGILTDFGHDVTACGDGTEAVALSAIGPIEVLVTDLVLRDDEGSTLSRHCAARGIPTITLTGYEFHIDRAEQDRPPLACRQALPARRLAMCYRRGGGSYRIDKSRRLS